MRPEHVVSIVAVAVTVAVVAFFLIWIVVELRRTHLQLVTILGAVDETVDKTDPLEPIVAEICADLAVGQAALVDCVERLEQRLAGDRPAAPVETPAMQRPTDGVRPTAFTNY